MTGWVSRSAVIKGVMLDLLLKTQVLKTCRFNRPETEEDLIPRNSAGRLSGKFLEKVIS